MILLIILWCLLIYFALCHFILILIILNDNFWVQGSQVVKSHMFLILLFALPVPLVHLGEGNLDDRRQALHLLIRPVRVAQVAQL